MTDAGIVVEFNLLDRQPTDPPDVLSLMDAITFMEQEITNDRFLVSLVAIAISKMLTICFL